MKKVEKAVVLCGGLGTRFLPTTKTIPKELLPIYDTPILELIVRELKKVGVREILIITNRNKNIIFDHFDRNYNVEYSLYKEEDLNKINNQSEDIVLYFLRQEKQNGTGGATLLSEKFVNDMPFFLTFGDDLILNENNSPFEQLLKTYNKFEKSILAVQEVKKKDIEKYGILKIKNRFKNTIEVADIIEKPKIEEAPSNLAYVGTALLTPKIFELLKKEEPKNAENRITDSYLQLAKSNELMAEVINGLHLDVGTPLSYIQSNVNYCKKFCSNFSPKD